MSYMQWAPALSVGVPEIDRQHQGFVELLNGLLDALHSGRAPEEIDDNVSLLRQHTIEHFRYEEMLLARSSYPRLLDHQQLHAAFVEQLTRVMKEHADGTTSLSIDTLNLMTHWLFEHVRGADQHAFEWVLTHG
jgi:hemerythrin